jgi:hypothetical protein
MWGGRYWGRGIVARQQIRMVAAHMVVSVSAPGSNPSKADVGDTRAWSSLTSGGSGDPLVVAPWQTACNSGNAPLQEGGGGAGRGRSWRRATLRKTTTMVRTRSSRDDKGYGAGHVGDSVGVGIPRQSLEVAMRWSDFSSIVVVAWFSLTILLPRRQYHSHKPLRFGQRGVLPGFVNLRGCCVRFMKLVGVI